MNFLNKKVGILFLALAFMLSFTTTADAYSKTLGTITLNYDLVESVCNSPIECEMTINLNYTGTLAPATIPLPNLTSELISNDFIWVEGQERLRDIQILFRHNETYIEKVYDVPLFKEGYNRTNQNISNFNETHLLWTPKENDILQGHTEQEVIVKTDFWNYGVGENGWVTEKDKIMDVRNITSWRYTFNETIPSIVVKEQPFQIKLKGSLIANTTIFSVDVIPTLKIASLDFRMHELAWWNSSWLYNKPINITNNYNENYTDYSVKMTGIDTSTLVSQGKLQADCDDLRFVDQDNTTQLSYWIESGCNTASTTIWVKTALNASTMSQNYKFIYMYYGNSVVSVNYSSPYSAFLAYDDFEDSSLNTTIWQSAIGGSGVATERAGYFEMSVPGGSSADSGRLFPQNAYRFAPPVKMVVDKDMSGANAGGVITALAQGDVCSASRVMGYSFSTSNNHRMVTACDGTSDATLGNIRGRSTTTIYATTDGKVSGDYGQGSPTYGATDQWGGAFRAEKGGGAKQVYVYEYRLMRYASTEPTVTFGSEQQGVPEIQSVTINDTNIGGTESIKITAVLFSPLNNILSWLFGGVGTQESFSNSSLIFSVTTGNIPLSNILNISATTGNALHGINFNRTLSGYYKNETGTNTLATQTVAYNVTFNQSNTTYLASVAWNITRPSGGTGVANQSAENGTVSNLNGTQNVKAVWTGDWLTHSTNSLGIDSQNTSLPNNLTNQNVINRTSLSVTNALSISLTGVDISSLCTTTTSTTVASGSNTVNDCTTTPHSGDFITDSIGSLSQDTTQTTTVNGTAYLTKKMNATNTLGIALTNITTGFTGRSGWTCAVADHLNFTSSETKTNIQVENCTKSNVLNVPTNRFKTTDSIITVGSQHNFQLTLTVNNTDDTYNYSNIVLDASSYTSSIYTNTSSKVLTFDINASQITNKTVTYTGTPIFEATVTAGGGCPAEYTSFGEYCRRSVQGVSQTSYFYRGFINASDNSTNEKEVKYRIPLARLPDYASSSSRSVDVNNIGTNVRYDSDAQYVNIYVEDDFSTSSLSQGVHSADFEYSIQQNTGGAEGGGGGGGGETTSTTAISEVYEFDMDIDTSVIENTLKKATLSGRDVKGTMKFTNTDNKDISMNMSFIPSKDWLDAGLSFLFIKDFQSFTKTDFVLKKSQGLQESGVRFIQYEIQVPDMDVGILGKRYTGVLKIKTPTGEKNYPIEVIISPKDGRFDSLMAFLKKDLVQFGEPVCLQKYSLAEQNEATCQKKALGITYGMVVIVGGVATVIGFAYSASLRRSSGIRRKRSHLS